MLLSGLIRTYNEEKNLPKCLDSLLSFCDEIVISDGGSTDGTRDIVRSYKEAGWTIKWLDFPGGSISDKVFFNHAGAQFNFGLDHCNGDWVITCDVDSMHCERLRKHLWPMLWDTPHDAFLMYGVHIVEDWGHYAGELGTGPGLTQLFRRKDGVRFPDQAEHVAYVDDFRWDNLGIVQGGVYHWGYINKKVEAAKIRLRHTAMPDDTTYAAIVEKPIEHKPLPIPWRRCHANCTSCWMEELAAEDMLVNAFTGARDIQKAVDFIRECLAAARTLGDQEEIDLQERQYEQQTNSLARHKIRRGAIQSRARELGML